TETTTAAPVLTTEAPTETTTAAPVLTTEAPTETTTAVPVMTTEVPAETTAAAPATTVTTAATKATTKATTTKKTSEVPSSTVLYGDTNLDGRVDITDAVLLNKAVANAVTLSSAARQNSDCMQDGELTSDDAVVLMQFLVHIVTNLPQ
ncbi:MAG: dockerin type I repeat-containing protein, partial [Ruminococcus callidus]|uniref:dockerin type I repeat-containing protein n=1 Tax=Ruminococcus callidus TaxID=40519 RepID=UPI0023F10A88